MQEDNIYQNGTQHLMSEPAAQAEERQKEEAALFNELPMLKRIHEHLEAQITKYSSLSSIPKELRLDTQKLSVLVDSNAETTQTLTAVKEFIELVAGEEIKK